MPGTTNQFSGICKVGHLYSYLQDCVCESFLDITFIGVYFTFSLIELDNEEIAQQLTIAEVKLFELVTQRELMNYVWGAKEKISAVQNILNHNSKITRWVITSILQAPSIKEKVFYYKKLYRLAKRLFDLKNYNACGTIIEGLIDISVQSIQELREV